MDGGNGAEIHRLSGHGSDVKCVIFTRDGKYPASGDGDGGVFLSKLGQKSISRVGILTFATAQ